VRGRGPWFIAVAGLVLLSLYFLILRRKNPVAPAILVVPVCKKLEPGMKRVELSRSEFQFDVPTERFTIKDSDNETPIGGGGLIVISKNGKSFMYIAHDSEASTEDMRPALDSTVGSSGQVERRKVFADDGIVVGEDAWGYWGNGEVWRRVQLQRSILARYGSINSSDRSGSVHQEDAKLFDQVVNSACYDFSPDEGK